MNLLLVLDTLMEERHVTRTAKRLRRSQSSVSHALSRLRVQLDDALLVKVGGEMRLTPKAAALQPKLRAVLGDLERALSPTEVWEPSTTKRHFRLVGPDFTAVALPAIMRAVREVSPDSTCEIVPIGPDMFRDVASGEYDLAFFRTISPRAAVVSEPLCTLEQVVFARRGHPALSAWSLDNWLAYPHVRIRMVGGVSPVDVGLATHGLERKPGPVVSSFLMVPSVLADSDAFFTAPYGVMAAVCAGHDLEVRPCPIEVPPIRLALFLQQNIEKDPGRRWFYEITSEVLNRTFSRRFSE